MPKLVYLVQTWFKLLRDLDLLFSLRKLCGCNYLAVLLAFRN